MPDREIRILHIITKLAIGGAQMNTLISARDINSGGYRSDVLTGPEDPPEGNLFSLADEWGINVLLAPHLRRDISPLSDIRAFFEIRRVIRNGGYDIVHTHGSKARILGRIAARGIPGTRVVQTAHGWPFWETQNPLVRQLYANIEKLFHYSAHSSIVVSPRDAEKAVSRGIGQASEYSVIRSGVEFEPFVEVRGSSSKAKARLGLDPNTEVVGSVMRFCTEKAPEVLLEAAKAVLAERPGVRFVLAGDGPLLRETVRKADALAISHAFHFLGSRKDIISILPAFDVFLITSRTEGLPRTLLESLAAGVPVVSTDAGGIGELVREGRNGILCPVGDSKGLAKGVLSLLEDPELRGRLIEHVDEDLEPFSARRMVQMLRQLYSELTLDRMKVVFLCDDEPFNIPRTVISVIRSRAMYDYVLVSLPGHGSVRNPLQNLTRYAGLYGNLIFPPKLLHFALLRIAALLNLPTKHPHSLRQVSRRTGSRFLKIASMNDSGSTDLFREMKPDVVFSIACPQILKKDILSIPSRGAWNVHSSLLPRNRGMLPSFWSLCSGDRPGVTVHRMVRKLDDGPILLQEPIDASMYDTSLHDLLKRSKRLASDLICRSLDLIRAGGYELSPNPIEEATFNRFPSRQDVRRFRDRGGVVLGRRKPRRKVALSFDIEEWFHTAAASRAHPPESWEHLASRVSVSVEIILEILRDFRSGATFFLLGWILEKMPEIVDRIIREGHEIACHGYDHIELQSLSRERFGEDLDRFLILCDRLSIPRPSGFRAPSFSMKRETSWAVDEMVSRGFTYDSSVYPMFRVRYGIPAAPLVPFVLKGEESSVLEFPLASLRFAGQKIPAAGGAYLRFYPGPVHRAMLRMISRREAVPVLYFHPWEFDSVNVSRNMSLLQRIRQHHNSGRSTVKKLRRILRNFEGVPLRELSGDIDGAGLDEFSI